MKTGKVGLENDRRPLIQRPSLTSLSFSHIIAYLAIALLRDPKLLSH
ncbi:MAG: hypothetical protein SAJ37_15055 [Oscillatoria sp. PMC 1068.18]|nr:hypothetical protein [Oscillatoria sp. PMC 1076.18]MEC4990049.1 hypothetical protein [Oscillatoria sp. PMC 1068.18]